MQQLAAFAFSLWLKAAPRGGMGISALLLRSIFSLIYGKAAGLRPLRSKAPLAIVLSPGFSQRLKPAPRGGKHH